VSEDIASTCERFDPGLQNKRTCCSDKGISAEGSCIGRRSKGWGKIEGMPYMQGVVEEWLYRDLIETPEEINVSFMVSQKQSRHPEDNDLSLRNCWWVRK